MMQRVSARRYALIHEVITGARAACVQRIAGESGALTVSNSRQPGI